MQPPRDRQVRRLGRAARRLARNLLLALAPAAAPAQSPEQRFEVIPAAAETRVGQPVWLRFRVRLNERDLLLDSVPRPIEAPSRGVRVLEVERLARGPDRRFEGRARVAFYRVGRQPVPTFGLPYLRIVAGLRGVLPSDSAWVNVVPTLPPGNPSLKDLKDLDRRGGIDPRWGWLAPVVLALGVAGVVLRRRRPPAAPDARADAGAPGVVLGPYQLALARLGQIERERWAQRGEVVRHYEAVAEVVRRYLEDVGAVPALERTTGEVVWALPPHLAAGGLRARCHELLADADLVKFARLRPDEAAAAALVRRARALLAGWHAAEPEPGYADAVR